MHCTASPINDFEGFLHIFYCRINNFTESLTEKLLRQVGWQGRVQNNRNSPHDVRSLDCRVLTQMYSPNLFTSRFWRVGEWWFLSVSSTNFKKKNCWLEFRKMAFTARYMYCTALWKNAEEKLVQNLRTACSHGALCYDCYTQFLVGFMLLNL